MSLFRPIQNDFSAGRISQRLLAKSDSPAFAFGLKECENFVPTPQGPLERRKGSQHLTQIDSGIGRLTKIRTSDDRNFGISITGDGKIRMVENGQPLAAGITTIYNSNDEGGVKTGSSDLDWQTTRWPSPLTPPPNTPWIIYGEDTFNSVRVWNDGDGSDDTKGYNSFEIAIAAADINTDVTFQFNISSISGSGWSSTRPPIVKVGTSRGGNDVLSAFTTVGGIGLQTVTFNPDGNTTLYITLQASSDGNNYHYADIDYINIIQETYYTLDVTTESFVQSSSNFWSTIAYNHADALVISPDMTKLICSVNSNPGLFEFDFGTPGDMSTLTYSGNNWKPTEMVGATERALHFKWDGLKAYISASNSNVIYQYTLSTPWDISTATYDSISYTVSQGVNTNGPIHIDETGTRLWVINETNDVIFQYTLSTPWDISTATYDSISFDTTTQVTDPEDFAISKDGKRLWVLDNEAADATIEIYDLDTPWDISTASYDTSVSLYTDVGSVPITSFHIDEYNFKIFAGVDDPSLTFEFFEWDVTETDPFVNVDHYYQIADIIDLQFDNHPTNDEVWIFSRNHQPNILSYNATTKLWSLVGAITNGDLTNVPSDWSTPPTWGNPPASDANFPGAGKFFEGRLWLGGTNDQKNGLYATAADGNYNTFLSPDTTTASTPIIIYIAARADIKWIAGTDDLLIGTNIGIYYPTSSTGLLTATDIVGKVRSRQQVNGAEPIFASALPVVVSSTGKVVADIVPAEDGEDFLSKELSFDHNDITDDIEIRHLDYSRCNDNSIYCTSFGSKAAVCLYNKHMNKIGWYDLVMGDGVIDIVTLEDQSTCISYALIKVPDENNRIDLVAMNYDEYIDSAYEIQNNSASTYIQAYHLRNKTVKVIADGVKVDDITLSSIGSGELATAATRVVIGHGYTSRIETLPKNIMGNMIDNINAAFKSWHKIYVHIKDSIRPTVNGYKTPDDLLSGVPIKQTEKLQVIDSGWDDEASIIVEQSDPYPCTILAIHGLMSEDEI